MGRYVYINGPNVGARPRFEPDYILDIPRRDQQEQLKVFEPELYKLQRAKELSEYKEKQKAG